MALRVFLDRHAVEWQVWDVYPTTTALVDRRRCDRRSLEVRVQYTGPERRTGDERRHSGPLLNPRFRSGWLVFRSYDERRRLVPIPAGWETLPDIALADLLSQAEIVPVTGLI